MNIEIGSDFNLKIKEETNLFFASGRIAIKSILNEVININEKCLIPNYLCDSIYNCFYNFDYYNIDNLLNIDTEYLENLINKNKYKLIFIINYFGKIDNNILYIKKICSEKNIIIIEDYTHNLYSNNLYGDICICSYRKSLETPYGSIVIDNNNLLKIKQESFINFKYLFYNILKISSMILKNIKYLKFIWYPILKYCEKNINNINYNGFDYINYFFYKYYYDIKNKYLRINNYNYLNKNLKYTSMFEDKDLYFTYPILFKTKEERNHIKDICIKNNIFCPVYWPLDFDKDYKCNHNITDNILCIPIDQRYNINHLKYIENVINNI
jgi:hypothetical protein